MLALVVCGLLFGCGGAPGDGESTQGNEAPYTQVEPREGASGTVSALAVYASSLTGAYVTFNSYGEHFIVQDTARDGHSALVQLSSGSTCWNSGGAGTTVDCNYDFPEGITIYFRACVGESGPRLILACAGWTAANTAN
jgi:hypothetical protein